MTPPMSSEQTVLVVDDDAKHVAMLVRYLEHAGFRTLTAFDGVQALAVAADARPHLVILDGMLPGLDGFTVCQRLQENGRTPVIMLTARVTEDDKLRGLALGADDYIVKPFSPRELVARAHAVLRRTVHESRNVITVGPIQIDVAEHAVQVRGEYVPLTATEFNMLMILARAPGRVFTRAELMERLFGWDYDGTERGVDAHIKNLRRKLEADHENPQLILTVFGVGYRLAKNTSRDSGR